ncbi:MAG: 2-C-methyl-D-erythritol 4-phosphate cytidylyltransferase [Microthrixaceae bacterium]
MADPAQHPDFPLGGTWCIVVAGGSGRRFGAPKQFEWMGDERVVDRSVRVAASVCDGVVLVLPQDSMGQVIVEHAAVTASGGSTRSASVRQGLAHVPDDARVVLVHDAARPLASPELFQRVVDAVRGGADAVVPVVPVADTIREVHGGVVDRDRLRAVQTPQGFDAATLRAAHAGDPEGTDDAGLVESMGTGVVLVEGEPTNLKITGPADLAIAALLAELADEVPDPADSGT